VVGQARLTGAPRGRLPRPGAGQGRTAFVRLGSEGQAGNGNDGGTRIGAWCCCSKRSRARRGHVESGRKVALMWCGAAWWVRRGQMGHRFDPELFFIDERLDDYRPRVWASSRMIVQAYRNRMPVRLGRRVENSLTLRLQKPFRVRVGIRRRAETGTRLRSGGRPGSHTRAGRTRGSEKLGRGGERRIAGRIHPQDSRRIPPCRRPDACARAGWPTYALSRFRVPPRLRFGAVLSCSSVPPRAAVRFGKRG
jgi:hypothetical protein